MHAVRKNFQLVIVGICMARYYNHARFKQWQVYILRLNQMFMHGKRWTRVSKVWLKTRNKFLEFARQSRRILRPRAIWS